MMMGSTITDIVNMFSDGLPKFEPTATHRVIACELDGTGRLWPAIVPGVAQPIVNHFVVGVPIAGSFAEIIKDMDDTTEHTTRRLAGAAAKVAGWSVRLTNTAGDCGIDAMSYHDGKGRSALVWRNIRHEISYFIEKVAGDNAWQKAFAACGEHIRCYVKHLSHQRLLLRRRPEP